LGAFQLGILHPLESFFIERNLRDSKIPVSFQDLKAVLLFSLKGRLVGEELKLKGVLIDRGIGRLGVLEDDGHTVIPALLLGHVKGRRVHAHG